MLFTTVFKKVDMTSYMKQTEKLLLRKSCSYKWIFYQQVSEGSKTEKQIKHLTANVIFTGHMSYNNRIMCFPFSFPIQMYKKTCFKTLLHALVSYIVEIGNTLLCNI